MYFFKNLAKKFFAFFGLRLSRLPRNTKISPPKDPIGDSYPIRLHGFSVRLNTGNTYPHITKNLPYFNAPLVELVNQAYSAFGRKVSFIDVGAATGDTILLLEQRCAGKVGSYTCFEGDEEFEKLLRLNTRQFDKVKVVNALLASERKSIPSLEKHHRGTASATGDGRVNAEPLDAFASEFKNGADVLKIDVDGYDGEVLKGGAQLLKMYQPWVIFEWHPALIQRAGTEYVTAFKALEEGGYKRFLWFSNTGHFSHFSGVPSRDLLQEMNRYLLRVNVRGDEHFDIVALPASAPAVELELATMDYSREVAHSMPVQ